MNKYKMRTAIKVKDGGKNNIMWIQLDCGHIVTPKWNGKTFYVECKTKCRCYECGDLETITSKFTSPIDKILAAAKTSLDDQDFSLDSWNIRGHTMNTITVFVYFKSLADWNVMIPVTYNLKTGSIMIEGGN